MRALFHTLLEIKVHQFAYSELNIVSCRTPTDKLSIITGSKYYMCVWSQRAFDSRQSSSALLFSKQRYIIE